jgi:hypothetical protein
MVIGDHQTVGLDNETRPSAATGEAAPRRVPLGKNAKEALEKLPHLILVSPRFIPGHPIVLGARRTLYGADMYHRRGYHRGDAGKTVAT